VNENQKGSQLLK